MSTSTAIQCCTTSLKFDVPVSVLYWYGEPGTSSGNGVMINDGRRATVMTLHGRTRGTTVPVLLQLLPVPLQTWHRKIEHLAAYALINIEQEKKTRKGLYSGQHER